MTTNNLVLQICLEGKGVVWIVFTFGYGYCFPLGYVMPVKRGKAMLGTRLSLRTRKANLSPSGDHQ